MKPFSLALLGAACLALLSCRRAQIPITFDGSTAELKRTVVLPTLDSPIPQGRNAIWCATFACGWKALQTKLGEPICLQGGPGPEKLLNAAADPRADIPDAAMFLAVETNFTNPGQLEAALQQRFPNKQLPPFTRSYTNNTCVVYAYLELAENFPTPYEQNREPVTFNEASGGTAEINTFGIATPDARGAYKLLNQPRVLFQTSELSTNEFEFAIDLCFECANEIVVARVPRRGTLAQAIAYTEQCISSAEKERHGAGAYLERIPGGQKLLVPDVYWTLTHRFSDLERREFCTTNLANYWFELARQDISFRLSKTGVALKSEASADAIATGVPSPDYALDRPFLLYMKKRSAKTPYFAMWVDNAELLSKWPSH